MVLYLSTDLKEKEIKEKVYNLIKYLGGNKDPKLCFNLQTETKIYAQERTAKK